MKDGWKTLNQTKNNGLRKKMQRQEKGINAQIQNCKFCKSIGHCTNRQTNKS